MATSTLRGDGLIAVHNALHALAADPQRIDLERTRFDRSPPQAYSNPWSPNSTLSQSPERLDDEQRRLSDIRWGLMHERDASTPYYQFVAQTRREREWLNEAFARHFIPLNMAGEQAEKINVVEDWKQQGIWDDEWHERSPGHIWKHEKPFLPKSERNIETEHRSSTGQPSLFANSSTPPPPPVTSLREKQKEKRQREASRPIHQFTHRLLKEADRLIKLERASGDVYTKAYTAVKNFWVETKIWDERWGLMPGKLWKHELPFEEEFANRCNGCQAYPVMDLGDEDEPAGPATGLCDTVSDPNPTSNEKSSRLGTGGTAGFVNWSAFPQNPNPYFATILSPIPNPFAVSSEASEAAGANASRENQQALPSPRPDQRRVRTSRVSKAPLRKNNARSQQRLPKISTASTCSSPQLPRPNGTKQTTHATTGTTMTPRRSSRLQAKNTIRTEVSKAKTLAKLPKGKKQNRARSRQKAIRVR